MDAVTYPNKDVIQLIQDSVIPVRIQHDRELGRRFNIEWTPTLVLLDARGNEVYRTVGFLPPEHLMSSLTLGLGKMKLLAGKYEEALSYFTQVASRYPRSEQAPEAMYYAGVARFKMTKDLKAMKEMYEKLSAAYPDSSWARKAMPYSGPE
ncbi:MAG TPA: tetratricopeptide repeat protein [Desulfomonilaceae bacterium]|nr:tetratricopeptide repeat protein [Desulfomonilaceae bacterium]